MLWVSNNTHYYKNEDFLGFQFNSINKTKMYRSEISGV
uniref:Uncharacterized protein n=1 Tax=Anguilla anguilla TaxID=7936 RepID=A0A0E9R262_ANGAN